MGTFFAYLVSAAPASESSAAGPGDVILAKGGVAVIATQHDTITV
jgi:hypothetical protein